MIDAKRDAGEDTTDYEPPEVEPDCAEAYIIFHEINRGRHHTSNGYPQPLALTEIVAALDFYHIVDEEERHDYLRFIRHLDSLYCRKASEKRTAEHNRNIDEAKRKAAARRK